MEVLSTFFFPFFHSVTHLQFWFGSLLSHIWGGILEKLFHLFFSFRVG